MRDQDAARRSRLLVVTVGARSSLRDAVARALTDLAADSAELRLVGDAPSPRLVPAADPVYAKIRCRARRFLDRAVSDTEIVLLHCASLPEVSTRLADCAVDATLALLCVDADGLGLSTDPFDARLDDALRLFFDTLPDRLHAELSPYSTVVYGDDIAHAAHVARPYVLRAVRTPSHVATLAADTIVQFTDHVQLQLVHRRLHSPTRGRTVLANALADFLTTQAGDRWGLHTYTGSIVAGVIADLEQITCAAGNPVVRGPSEHSLACGALARWQLAEAPFLIVATSGMIDEFKGTLANLREAGAAGFVICGEAPPDRWFPFQGTVHDNEDARAVLQARQLPTVYLDRVDTLAQDLRAAFDLYHAGRGPVVLLATPAVLEFRGHNPVAAPASRPPNAQVIDGPLDQVVSLINAEPTRLLWQCGAVPAPDSGLVYDLARSAGIALVDTLARPGAICGYRDGRPVPEYLGTLSMYGYSARAYQFLHRNGRLRPPDEHCVFFLASRIAEVNTPFPPRILERGLRIGQVTRTRAHLAPFATYPIYADVGDFLRAVRDRLDVDADVLRHRRDAIEQATDSTSDVISQLATRPMSPNYFYHQLAGVLRTLIERDGYTYTGVYDVGRGGLSAIRNLPRTALGFSGWYGRALMGDAVQAIPAIALTRPGNVLAFVGDGGAALVPDIVPTLVHQIALEGIPLRGNLTIFRLVNGGHSIIRTYREAHQAAPAGRQTSVLSLIAPEQEHRYGPVTVRHRRLDDVDPDRLRSELQEPGVINLYSVVLSHNNEGDGLSLLSALGWQRDELPELALRAAR